MMWVWSRTSNNTSVFYNFVNLIFKVSGKAVSNLPVWYAYIIEVHIAWDFVAANPLRYGLQTKEIWNYQAKCPS